MTRWEIEQARQEKARKQREEEIDRRGGRCIRCGESNPDYLDFHHKDSSLKVKNLAKMWGHSFHQRLLEELDKCELICKTCHSKDHAGPKGEHGTSVMYGYWKCRCGICREFARVSRKKYK